jgi:hypothetical protein
LIFKLVERPAAVKVKLLMLKENSSRRAPRRKLPRSFKDLTPAKHFNPRTFFQELIWKAWLTPRTGRQRARFFRN